MSSEPVQLYNYCAVPKPNLSQVEPEPTTMSARHLRNHRLHPDFDKKYSLGQELGSGGFGFVVSAYERRTGIERAVKFIFRNRVPASGWVRDPEMGPIPMEIYVLKHVRHQNIVQFQDAYQDATFFYLVMELHGTEWSQPLAPQHPPTLSNTSDDSQNSSVLDSPIDPPAPAALGRRTSCDLFECIEQHHNLDESLAKDIFRQIVDCVAYLDKLGICHRDIKDENIVIDSDYKVKLIDFGSSVILPRQRSKAVFSKFYGTISFASPEILRCEPYRAEPAEIWSLGVLLYTILFGEVPFHDPAMAMAGCFAQPKLKVSPECLHLISCMLERSPSNRPSIHQVLSHPWLREN
ncbi:hypothetical protein DFQ28_003541 [Apophysomyces sp. BC1034]|nr:hypothetical protein DFQ30_007149 [Apophysomyces sp. BC1015]KAG0179071.1 hypothetical protein DFQ29_002650 [Apophysomyces sp. BC1021]KAG0189340.1 hypothetical protein DFQ28_003541 [Apophysomyces sp. BC1034]